MTIETDGCKAGAHTDDHAPAWHCDTHDAWVQGDDRCPGPIGSPHCGWCADMGCVGPEHCTCHPWTDDLIIEAALRDVGGTDPETIAAFLAECFAKQQAAA